MNEVDSMYKTKAIYNAPDLPTKCLACGAPLTFTDDNENLLMYQHCPACHTNFRITSRVQHIIAYTPRQTGDKKAASNEEVIKCPKCGSPGVNTFPRIYHEDAREKYGR